MPGPIDLKLLYQQAWEGEFWTDSALVLPAQPRRFICQTPHAPTAETIFKVVKENYIPAEPEGYALLAFTYGSLKTGFIGYFAALGPPESEYLYYFASLHRLATLADAAIVKDSTLCRIIATQLERRQFKTLFGVDPIISG